MAKEKVPLTTLQDFLPPQCFDEVSKYLHSFQVQLTITRQRSTILGDFRNAHQGKPHRISVNGNLNSYNFLITLLHELAHLLTYHTYQHKVLPHGKEWKTTFSNLLITFMEKDVFPDDIRLTLKKSIAKPSASSCGDAELLRVLKKYDPKKKDVLLVEELDEGMIFTIKDGRKFVRGKKIRTRIQCTEISSRKMYLFSGLYEVKQFSESTL
jgi:hypothetical protein